MADINVEYVTWMQVVTDKANGKKFYTIGTVNGREKTLLVTPVGGNGRAMMYCQTHLTAYDFRVVCPECQNAPRDERTAMGVTTS